MFEYILISCVHRFFILQGFDFVPVFLFLSSVLEVMSQGRVLWRNKMIGGYRQSLPIKDFQSGHHQTSTASFFRVNRRFNRDERAKR